MIHTDGKSTIANRVKPVNVNKKSISRAKNVRSETEVLNEREALFGMREYYPNCRCDPRRPLNPRRDHEKDCPVRKK